MPLRFAWEKPAQHSASPPCTLCCWSALLQFASPHCIVCLWFLSRRDMHGTQILQDFYRNPAPLPDHPTGFWLMHVWPDRHF